MIPFRSEICHPIIFLHLLRTSSRQSSCGMVRDEEITTGHFLFSSRYAYFNSAGNGFRISFGDSSFPISCVSSSLNKDKIYCLVFQRARVESKSEGSGDPSSSSPRLSFKSYSIFLSQCSSTKFSIIHTSSGPSSYSGWNYFLHK